jgi:hypothetical protein
MHSIGQADERRFSRLKKIKPSLTVLAPYLFSGFIKKKQSPHLSALISVPFISHNIRRIHAIFHKS